MLKRSHDHRYTPVLDLAQLGAIPPPDKELVMPCPPFSGSEMVLTFWSFLFEGRVAEESLEEREFQGRLRGYNQLNILVNAKVKSFKTSVLSLLLFCCFCYLCSADGVSICVCPPRRSTACVCVASAFVFRPRVAGRSERGLACNGSGAEAN